MSDLAIVALGVLTQLAVVAGVAVYCGTPRGR